MKLYLSISILLLFSKLSLAQITILQENFTAYNGSLDSVPYGWNFSVIGSNSFYATTVNSGNSGPNAYKFSVDDATILSPVFNNADSLSFWIKGVSTDSLSSLIILQTIDTINWDTLATINSLPTTAANGFVKMGLSINTIRLKFIYKKSAGNLSFDDFLLTNNIKPKADFAFSNACFGENSCFVNLSSIVGQANITNYYWDFNDGETDTSQNPCHFFVDTGTYDITLITMASNGSGDTISKAITISSLPSPKFGAVHQQIHYTVQFTDTTFLSSGNIVQWQWNYGDGSSIDTIQNPTHTYTNGQTYTVCLTVNTNNNCSNTFCDTVAAYVVMSLQEVVAKKNIFCFPNPSNGRFNVYGKIDEVEIFNLQSELIYKIRSNNSEALSLDLTDKPPGIYVAKIRSGELLITKRLEIIK